VLYTTITPFTIVCKNLSKQTKSLQCFTDYATESTYRSNIYIQSIIMLQRILTLNENFKRIGVRMTTSSIYCQ